ncbi:MAG: glycosyltransferase, partial [Deltaproteobacteria bacterium]
MGEPPIPSSTLAVLISTYNAPAFLRLSLDAWERQTDLNFRIYIADDGSGHDTREMIDAFRLQSPVPIEHIWHEDQGFRKARIHNRALSRIEEP